MFSGESTPTPKATVRDFKRLGPANRQIARMSAATHTFRAARESLEYLSGSMDWLDEANLSGSATRTKLTAASADTWAHRSGQWYGRIASVENLGIVCDLKVVGAHQFSSARGTDSKQLH